MGAQCFMVDGVMDAFIEGGGKRVGAMFYRSHGRKGYDLQPKPMMHLAVMTPAGIACLDCPADKDPHGYWTRSGEPPNITVTPSLNINPDGDAPESKRHGFLTAGVLTP